MYATYANRVDSSINHKFGHCVMQLIVMLRSASDKPAVAWPLHALCARMHICVNVYM